MPAREKIREAARITDASGRTTYEVEIGRKDLIFDIEGNLVPLPAAPML